MLLLIIIAFSIFIVLILYLFWLRPRYKKNNSIRLFYIALKSENNSHFIQAIDEYETALEEIKRTGNNAQLRIRIMEKIKLLNTVLQYQRG